MTKKKKLNKQQIRRLRFNQQRKLEQIDNAETAMSEHLGDAEHGVIVSRYGQQADVKDSAGDTKRCDIRRNIDSLVAGDKVVWRKTPEGQSSVAGVIEAVNERETVLNRPDFYDGLKPVAANIEQVLVVSSIKPDLSLQIIDRYLVAIEDMGAQPVIVINKIELLSPEELLALRDTMAYYQKIGYQVFFTSVKKDIGVSELMAQFIDKTSIVVGQSGVGKSSLINLLLPDVNSEVAEISENSGLGQHTTTVSKLYDLPGEGSLIDSPGVREFSLWHLTEEAIFSGFIEFAEFKTCRFRDCKHKNTPNCGILAAVEQGIIPQSRLDSFHRIMESKNEDAPSRFNSY